MSNFSKSVIYQVWNDVTGSRVEVSEDPDGCGLVEVDSIEGVNKKVANISLPVEAARMLAQNIMELCDNMEAKEQKDSCSRESEPNWRDRAIAELSRKCPNRLFTDVWHIINDASTSMKEGQKLRVVTMLRNFGLTLRESKEFMENYLSDLSA